MRFKIEWCDVVTRHYELEIDATSLDEAADFFDSASDDDLHRAGSKMVREYQSVEEVIIQELKVGGANEKSF